jgi:hypothetical protein
MQAMLSVFSPSFSFDEFPELSFFPETALKAFFAFPLNLEE